MPTATAMPEVEPAVIPTAPRFYAGPQKQLNPVDPQRRAEANLDALRIILRLRDEQRPATPDEQATIARFSGWGAVPHLFDDDPDWDDLRAALRPVLEAVHPDAWAAASAATLNSHYTDADIAAVTWGLLRGLGLANHADGTPIRVWEPGVGSGVFLSTCPKALNVDWYAVDIDPTAVAVTRALHPHATVDHTGLEQVNAPDDTFDLVVGNVPFGNYKLTDPRHNKHGWTVHHHAVYKAICLTRPGGLIALLSSHYLADGKPPAVRQQLDGLADLVAVIRFPNRTFERSAGTSVIEDLLIFRRRPVGGLPFAEQAVVDGREAPLSWIESVTRSAPGVVYRVNGGMRDLAHPPTHDGLPYLLALGTQGVERGGHSKADYWVSLTKDGNMSVRERAVGLFQQASSEVVQRARAVGCLYVPPEPDIRAGDEDWDARWREELDCRKEGSIHLTDDGGLVRITAGRALPYKAPKTADSAELRALVDLRDATVSTLAAMVDGDAPNRIAAAQGTLGMLYDSYAAQFGPLNRYREVTKPKVDPETGEVTIQVSRFRPTMGGFRADPDFYSVLALEVWDEATRTATKAPIFRENVVGHPVVARPTGLGEAVAVSLNATAGVDVDVIARSLDWTVDRTETELRASTLAYENPATGCWEHASVYLSGDVRSKFDIADAAALVDPDRYQRNADALLPVIPADLGPEDIDLRLGSPMIDTDDIERFCEDILDCKPDVIHLPAVATWEVDGASVYRSTVKLTAEWGTRRAGGLKLLEWALNLKPAAVYDTVVDATTGKDRRVLNKDETERARAKLEELADRFASWLWEDPDRSAKYVDRYNRRANCWAAPTFDGSHLTLPGLSPAWKMRPHQTDAIWRGLVEGGMVLAHSVGLGKAQPLDAPVLTPTGFRPIGDLAEGDEVVAADGTTTTVTGVFPQGELDFYRVTFTDGSTAECNDEHLWAVRGNARSWPNHAGERVAIQYRPRTLRSMFDEGLLDAKGQAKWHIPQATPVDLDQGAERPLEPYFLGILLGDGSLTDKVGFSSADLEIVGHMVRHAPRGCQVRYDAQYDYVVTSGGRGKGTVNPAMEALRQLGLYGHDAFNKFVPEPYKMATVADRLSILQGLMDSDGTAQIGRNANCSPIFNSSCKQLAEDVRWLVQSLGGTGRLSERMKLGKPRYDVVINLPRGMSPFRLGRKAAIFAAAAPRKQQPDRAIASVDLVGRTEMRCISVDHPDHLYVTSEFVVTHNTAVMVGLAVEMRRLGIAGKPLIVVPNHMLEQIAREARQLYPAARMLICTQEDSAKPGRRAFIARCATGNWDLVVMTHSAFGLVPLSAMAQARYIARQISTLRRAMSEAGRRVKEIEKSIKRKEAKVRRALEAGKDQEGMTFEELGCDHIQMDEAHLFKNLDTSTSVQGLRANSNRAEDLACKIDWLTDRYGDFSHRGPNPMPGLRRRRVVLATGTPVANSIAELWVMSRYADYPRTAQAGYEVFDGWFGAFGQTVARLEVSPDGGGFRVKDRPARFRNVPELLALWLQVADVRSLKTVTGIDVPAVRGGGRRIVTVEGSTGHQRFVAELMRRADRIAQGKPMMRPTLRAVVDEHTGQTEIRPVETEDNLLWVVTDGRKAALHLPLVGQNPDPDGGKIRACAVEVARVYHETKTRGFGTETAGALQLVFCDLGVNPGDRCGECGYPLGQGDRSCATCSQVDHVRGRSVYEMLRLECARLGVPYGRVRFMTEARNDAEKANLFAACRDGLVSVLVGSTERMGIGTNVQTRAVALHHLDAPWRPCDIEQREGRIVRQGNLNGEVETIVYVTAGTFDAFMWQTLETKAGFIEQVTSGRVTARTIDDVGETSLGFAEIKAAAAGNPIILDHARASLDLKAARGKASSHLRHVTEIRTMIGGLEFDRRLAEADAQNAARDVRSLDRHDGPPTLRVDMPPTVGALELKLGPQDALTGWVNWWRDQRDTGSWEWRRQHRVGRFGPWLVQIGPDADNYTAANFDLALPMLTVSTAIPTRMRIGRRDCKLPGGVMWEVRIADTVGDPHDRLGSARAKIGRIDSQIAEATAQLDVAFPGQAALAALEERVAALDEQMRQMTDVQSADPASYQENPSDTVDWAALEAEVMSQTVEDLVADIEAASVPDDGWECPVGETDTGQLFLFPEMTVGPPRPRRRRKAPR